jgi:hypothetical protein
MQRILFILTAAVLSLLAGEAYAQRDLPGQTGIQFTTGGVNHFLSWKSGGERHYFTSLAFTHTNRNRTYWLYGLDYQIKEYTYENKAIQPIGTVTVGMCKGQRGEVVAFTATLP